MASSQNDSILSLVKKIKLMLIIDSDSFSTCVSPSAYDTAWLAMIHNPKEKHEKPLFKGCLDWVLNNQNQEGFWGEVDCNGNPTIDSLPATLACMVALRTWSVGHEHVEKGMEFIRAYSRKLLEAGKGNHVHYFPRWFVIVFPGMVQLAQRNGIKVVFSDNTVKEVVAHIFRQRHQILAHEKVLEKNHYEAPLLSYLEALPTTYQIDHATILNNLDDYGSLFQSPSATAAAFMVTGNAQTLSYLHRLLSDKCFGYPDTCIHVPSMYPIDSDCIKLLMVNQLERLGLSDLFADEIKGILEHIYRQYKAQEPSENSLIPAKMFKNSLAFELLRLNGYRVSPRRLCWFLNDETALEHVEKNYDKLSSMLYGLYRATNLAFLGETELYDLRSFTRRLLVRSCQQGRKTTYHDELILWQHLQEEIRHEISVPWTARMDHLSHRKWIESNMEWPLWLGKASFYRVSCLDNKDLLELAKANYEHRQAIYKKELEELLRWSKVWGLLNMGFARDKTTYSYFAVSSSTSLPHDSDIRLIVAKSAVLVTIADDFFDKGGSLDELQILTKAVQRWSNEGLRSHSRVLFDALDDFVSEMANKYLDQHNIDITNNLREIWYETFASWLMEATWSRTGQIPSMASYLETGMISISAHTLVLQAEYFLTPSSTPRNLDHSRYKAITKFLMISCRLLNDIQSYEKEQKEGKFNSVLLYLKENPNANIDDAICFVQSILDDMKMKLIEHALMNGFDDDDDMPRPSKKLHLSCLKVFQMFFNSTNHFDSKDSMISDINKAIFEPLEHHTNSFQTRKKSTHHTNPFQTRTSSISPHDTPLKNKNLVSKCHRILTTLKCHHNWRSSPSILPRIHHSTFLRSRQGRMMIRSPNLCNFSSIL